VPHMEPARACLPLYLHPIAFQGCLAAAMSDLIQSIEFWVAMIAASLIKVRASPRITFWGAVITVFCAVTSALVFTMPLMDWLELTGDIHVAAVAALVALSAEHFARQILDLKLIELIRAWRGK